MPKKQNLSWSELSHFTEKQKQASDFCENYDYVLYGGAMGGGKSYWLRWQLVKLLINGYRNLGLKGIRVGLFCEDYPALKDRHISKVQYEFPKWLGVLNKADYEFTLDKGLGFGVICFRNLDDPSKYSSAEFAVIAIDELTKNKKEVFDFLRTRLRWPGLERPKFIAGTNPGGIGHAWVKKMWLDHKFETTERHQNQFKFISAKVKDNPYLNQNYYDSLMGLPEKLRKAYVDGNWDIFEGMYFTEFDREVHVIPPLNKNLITSETPCFVSIDYGYSSPSAVYWFCVNADKQLIVYREFYQKYQTYKDLIFAIQERTEEKIDYVVLPHDVYGKATQDSGKTGKELFSEAGFYPILGNKDRLNGWRYMRDFLRPIDLGGGRKTARLQICDCCPNLIRTLPEMVHDDKKPEDLDSEAESHASDSVRYGIMSRFSNPKLPKTENEIIDQTLVDLRKQTTKKRFDFEERRLALEFARNRDKVM